MVKFNISVESDVEVLRNIAMKAFEKDRIKYGFMPPKIDILEWHLSKVKNGMYYKMILENQLIGGINLYDLGNKHFRLGAIYIEPAFQNQKIGAEAINFIENTYPHVKKWSIDTPYQNYRNHHFYEKLGYVKTAKFKPEKDIDFWLFEYVKEIY